MTLYPKHREMGFIKYLCTTSAIFLTACSSGQLIIDSLPQGGSVFLRTSGDSYEKLGQTPYIRLMSDITSIRWTNDSLSLEIRKEGFVPKSLVITDPHSSSDIKITTSLRKLDEQLRELLKSEVSRDDDGNLTHIPIKGVNLLMDEIFEAQRLIRVSRFSDARQKLNSIQEQNPNLSIVYELRGGLFYLQKDYVSALDDYTEAVKYNPNNLQTINMHKYLKKMLRVEEKELPQRTKASVKKEGGVKWEA